MSSFFFIKKSVTDATPEFSKSRETGFKQANSDNVNNRVGVIAPPTFIKQDSIGSKLSQIPQLASDASMQMNESAWKKVSERVHAYSKLSTSIKISKIPSKRQSDFLSSEETIVFDVHDEPLYSGLVQYNDNLITFRFLNVQTGVVDQYLEIDNATKIVTNISPIDYKIPIQITSIDEANSANIQLTMAWLGVKYLEVKRRVSEESGVSAFEAKDKRNRVQSNEALCCTHDLGCSQVSEIGILDDGSWWLWFPCAGKFKANVSDCCKDHDISIWCAKNQFEIIEADTTVVACIFGKVMDACVTAMSSWCKNFMFPAFAIYFSTTVLFELFMLAYGLGYKDYLTNRDGRNSDSCLCGGTKPTVSCKDHCRDLCWETSKKQECDICGWRCIYDDYLNPIGVEWQNPLDGHICCPTTTAECQPSFDEALPNCPKRCTTCTSECGVDPVWGYRRYVVNPSNGKLPCCQGTPTVSLKEPCPDPPNPFDYDYR